MDKKDLYLDPEPIDNVTDYGKGLTPNIDPRTDYGKGLEPNIDPRTDYGRGISYKTCDGKDVATMEEVMQYNQMFYERMMNNSEGKGMHR